MEHKWIRSRFTPCLPLGKDGTRVTACREHIDLSRRAAAEGMVLLKNDGTLPLEKETKLAIFGTAQFDYVKGGGGSGDVTTSYIRNIYDGFKEKEKDGKIKVFDKLSQFYKKEVQKQYEDGIEIGRTSQPDIPEELFKEAKEFADTALISVCRFSGEGWDRSSEKGDFYLSEAEEKTVQLVCENFGRVFAVMDVGGIIDTEWFKDNGKIGAALLAWNGGIEGGAAIADIVCGDVNPSGKLTDTLAKTFEDYPSSANFNESEDYVKYYEDIYVGYRYFETIPHAAEKVNYPFGYGLSYTSFEIGDVTAKENEGEINVSAKITNVGNCAGKEVLQVYYSAPQGTLGKPAKELAAFKKTALLKPGESETVSVSFNITDMASYDDRGKCEKSAYVLEGGKYLFYVGNSVRKTIKTEYEYEIKENFIVCSKLTKKCAPYGLEKRLTSDGSYESLEILPPRVFDYEAVQREEREPGEGQIMFDDVAEGKESLEDFIAGLSDRQLCGLLGGTVQDTPFNQSCNMGVANTAGIANIPERGVPAVMTCDGPAGIRIREECGVCTTAWPCATLLACTWNPELVYEIGRCGAMEAKENNLGVWLTPAMNIHRTPLCGRNFEYFSEDPLIAGEMASAKVRGIQSQKIAATVKHFACNNKETNRRKSDSIVSERALREIYIKGFEICVKEAEPWVVMTSYNRLNGHQASEDYELITGILRGEWGFSGAVMSDWRTLGLHGYEVKAGQDIKMSLGYPESLMEFITAERLSRAEIEEHAQKVLELILKIDC